MTVNWSNLAPQVPFPVEVLIKSPPAHKLKQLILQIEARLSSSQFSRMTLRCAFPQLFLTSQTSSMHSFYFPSSQSPLLITISISSAPSLTACLVSRVFTDKNVCPVGKFVLTTAVLTPVFFSSLLTQAEKLGQTQIAAGFRLLFRAKGSNSDFFSQRSILVSLSVDSKEVKSINWQILSYSGIVRVYRLLCTS